MSFELILMDKRNEITFNKKTLNEFKNILKQGYRIPDIEGRKKFVEDSGLNEYVRQYGELIANKTIRVGSNSTSAQGTSNIYGELIASYLVRALDVESPRSGEYPFFRDENRFKKSGKHMVLNKPPKHEDDEVEDIVEQAALKDLENNHMYTSMLEKNLTYGERVEILKGYNEVFKDDYSFGNRDGYEEISRDFDDIVKNFYNNCNNSEDKIILDMYRDGYTLRQIGDELGKSYETIRKRLRKLSKNG